MIVLVTKEKFLALRKKHSYENPYKVKSTAELQDLVRLVASIDPNMDLNWLDVSNVDDMEYLFRDSKFNGDISERDVHAWYADRFNPKLGINDKQDLKNYISFLRAIYNNKPIELPIKRDWLKTKGLPLHVVNRISEDADFAKNIKKVLC